MKKIDFHKKVSEWEKGVLGPEMKYLDTNFATTNFGNPTPVNPMPLIAQGVGASQRLGDRILVKHIMIEGYMLQTSDAANSYFTNPMRVQLILDRQVNGALAAGSDVMDGTIVDRLRPNLSNEQRFVVLLDEWISINGHASASAVSMPFRYEMECEIPVEYSGTTAAIGSVSKNALFMMFTARGVPDNTQPEIRGYFRVRYIDL